MTTSTRCRICKRALWSPSAIKAGIGPKCAAKRDPRFRVRCRRTTRLQGPVPPPGVPLFPEWEG